MLEERQSTIRQHALRPVKKSESLYNLTRFIWITVSNLGVFCSMLQVIRFLRIQVFIRTLDAGGL